MSIISIISKYILGNHVMMTDLLSEDKGEPCPVNYGTVLCIQ